MFKSNYFKIFMKLNKISFGKNLNLYGIPVMFKKRGSILKIGNNCTIKSSFLSNLIGLSQRTIIVTRTKEAKIETGSVVTGEFSSGVVIAGNPAKVIRRIE